MAIIFKERGIKHSPMIVPIASVLLIYMPPGEVYHVLIEMIKKSVEAFKTEEETNLIRWHFNMEKG